MTGVAADRVTPVERGGRLLACAALCWALWGSAWAQVVVNEVHYNPPGDDDIVRLEFLELHNAGTLAVDVSGWRLEFGPEPFVFPMGSSIPPGGYVVVAENVATLAAATGHTAGFQWAGLATGLGNGGDAIVLRDAAQAVRDSVTYDDDPPWPTEPDGNGPSLELLDPGLDNALSSAWRPSAGTNGTPGAINSVFSTAPAVASELPRRQSAVETMTAVTVTFSAPVTGVTADDLTVGGAPASAVDCATCQDGGGTGPYVFSGFATPPPGSTAIVLAPGAIEAAGVPFGGDQWTVSVGLVVVLDEIHYHPANPNDDAEFVEIGNAGTNTADLSGWTVSDGLTMTFPAGTTLAPGVFVVIALNPGLLQSVTGYAGALAWAAGRLDNAGERLALSDAAGNEHDVVRFGDRGTWSSTPDGNGPSLELVHPRLANEFGGAWKASAGPNGTPGAVNSTHQTSPAPIVFETRHQPAIPAPFQEVAITARVIDDQGTPVVTLHHRPDQVPTLAYAPTPMFDDGTHGDGAAGDLLYGALVPGLADGQRLDFTIRAADGDGGVGAAPLGHDTLSAGGNPSQTYLCKFSSATAPTDFPVYHMITTQHVRDLQTTHDENTHDATFIRCPVLGSCEIFYNVTERYRGATSLNQHPHSFNIDFSGDQPLASEMGFDIRELLLMSQSRDKQHLGYQLFRQAFGGAVPASRTQWVRLDTNPLSHGGTQAFVYVNVERVDADFLASQDGNVTPLRYPDRCSASGTACLQDADCLAGETCSATDNGNLYEGEDNATLQYLGPTPEDGYRTAIYDKRTNEEADAWGDLIDLCQALDPDTTPDQDFESAVASRSDELEWARYFALHMLLVNQEGGIYRDTGDDYYLYFQPGDAPDGLHARIIPWDMDSTFGGFAGAFNQETIWRTSVETPRRFLRSNAFAGRFVGAICQLLETDFTQAAMDARIDALPSPVAGNSRKQQLKQWVADRRDFVQDEIVDELTLELPPSPYTGPSPLTIEGRLNQCGTRTVEVNGAPATFSVFDGTWSQAVPLVTGPNTIVVRDLDHQSVELDRVEAFLEYHEPSVASFQHGAGGYAGTVDTYLEAGMPNANRSAVTTLIVDGGVPPELERQILLRFDGLFDSEGGPIPKGADIFSATLTVNVVNGSLVGAELHRMRAPWNATSTWNSLVGGVQLDGVEAEPAADAAGVYNGPPLPARYDIDVTTSVAAWSGGAANLGWAFVTPAGGSDSWQFSSADRASVDTRPKLSVTYGCNAPVATPTIALGRPGGIAELTWSPMPKATSYDVVRGSLSVLRSTGGDFAQATDTCLANDLPATSVQDPSQPGPDDGFWYLARGVNCGGVATFDSLSDSQIGMRDGEILSSPGVCP